MFFWISVSVTSRSFSFIIADSEDNYLIVVAMAFRTMKYFAYRVSIFQFQIEDFAIEVHSTIDCSALLKNVAKAKPKR